MTIGGRKLLVIVGCIGIAAFAGLTWMLASVTRMEHKEVIELAQYISKGFNYHKVHFKYEDDRTRLVLTLERDSNQPIDARGFQAELQRIGWIVIRKFKDERAANLKTLDIHGTVTLPSGDRMSQIDQMEWDPEAAKAAQIQQAQKEKKSTSKPTD